MAHVNIILIFIIFVYLGRFSVLSQTAKDHGLPLSFTHNYTSDALYMPCIYKCCPSGHHVMQKIKTCLPYEKFVDFSSLSVYDKELRMTANNVQDTFTILDGRFEKDSGFRDVSLNMNKVGYISYVLEDGDLQLEKPNAYDRWVSVPNKNFCIDYIINKTGSLSAEPKFFVVISKSLSAIVIQDNMFLAVARWISCVFLLLLLVVYALLPELRNLGGLILMNYVATLFVAFLLLAVIQLDKYTVTGCEVLTLGIYYFFLASFCWMSVMSYDIWWTFRGYAKARPIHRRGKRFKLLMYCLFAYGVPLLMTIFLCVVLVKDMRHVPWLITPNLKDTGCFLEGAAKMLYLYVPMLALIVSDWALYALTALNMWRLTRGTRVLDTAAAGTPAAHRRHTRRFVVYLKLSVVMGLSWVFEIVSFVHPQYGALWCLSDAYNMLIGLLIFIIFVCKKKIYRKLYKRLSQHYTKRRLARSSKSYTRSSSDSCALRVCADPQGRAGCLDDDVS